MRHSRHKQSPRVTLGRLFILVGLPLVSMCLTFIALYVIGPMNRNLTETPQIAKSVQLVNAPVAATTSWAGPPVRLVIASINVDAIINPVGLTKDGAMDIGENPDQVAWYQAGPIPGQDGNAVIAGHYGWKNGHGSVFNNLHDIKVGDSISVYDAKGLVTSFIVRQTRLYDPAADAADVFISNDNKPHLNLITCEGTWVTSKDSYSNRLVVFADLKK